MWDREESTHTYRAHSLNFEIGYNGGTWFYFTVFEIKELRNPARIAIEYANVVITWEYLKKQKQPPTNTIALLRRHLQ